jgi:hypothetical protein
MDEADLARKVKSFSFSRRNTVKPSPKMQQILQLLAEKHGRNLFQEGAHLRLSMAGYQPLVIECIGLSRVMVAHYFTHNGDLVPDPLVTLFTGDPKGWMPLGITYSLGSSQTYAVVHEDGTQVTCFNHRKQQDLAEFTEIWAQNLIDQRWLEHGERAKPSLFPLGQVVATPGALVALEVAGKDPRAYLARHRQGDWGDLDAEDSQANHQALQDGNRLLSAYQVTPTLKIWIITEWDRSATTVLLPSEY